MFARTRPMSIRRSTRRPHHRRAAVEVLDARRLMAASITGTPVPVAGNYGQPVTARSYEDSVGIGGQGYNTVTSPIPVQLLTSSDMSSTLSAAGYTGTIDWGDGSAAVPATFGNFVSPPSVFVPSNELYVNGPGHTYANPGTYTITVTVTAPGATAPTTYTDTATISTNPPLTGGLDPASDTGFFNNDHVTADNTPTFTGTTAPGATVVLSTTNVGTGQVAGTGQTLVVGTGVADAFGRWSITTVPFVDGGYSFSATATNSLGGSTTTSLTGSYFSYFPVYIDTAGPRITSFQVTDARTGAFAVGYADPYGMLIAPTVDPNLIAANRPSPTPSRGQKFPVQDLKVFVTSGGFVTPPPFADTAVLVTGTLSPSKALIPRNGAYTYTIYGAGILGLSGAQLDGEYRGSFPTGNGQAGGNFQVRVNVKNGQVTGITPIASTRVTARAVHPKAPTRHHA